METLPLWEQDSNSPEKRCKGTCGCVLPATTDHFYSTGKGRLLPKCKVCMSKAYYSKPEVLRKQILAQKVHDENLTLAEVYRNLASSEDLAYLAGIIDGEGCLDIHLDRRHNSYYPRIRVEMAHYETIAWIQALFPGLKFNRVVRKNIKHNPTYRWCVQGPRAIVITIALLPYLKGKRKEAELFITFPYPDKKPGFGHLLTKEMVAERDRLRLALREQKTKGKGRIKHE